MDDLKGKVILVTGASTGIGAACAKAFGALGCKVTVHYNSSKTAAMAVAEAVEKAGGEALRVQGDLRLTADCERKRSNAWAVHALTFSIAAFRAAQNV